MNYRITLDRSRRIELAVIALALASSAIRAKGGT
jgi:hypothetical protein